MRPRIALKYRPLIELLAQQSNPMPEAIVPTTLPRRRALDLATSAMNECGLGVTDVRRDEAAGRVSGRTGVSLISFGEEISITVQPNPSGFLVRSVGSNPIDWGKGSANVRRLSETLKRLEPGF
jgi:hypothetical protein